MRNRISVVLVAGLLLCCVAFPVYAQGKCSLQTMVGTYAFYEKGSSLIMYPNQQPYLLHWSAALAPFANVAEITFKPNGVGEGFYWIYIGSLPHPSYDPIPVQVTITEMNENCTGKFTYVANLPGGLSATVEERILVFDDGREFRSVPTSIQNGIETLAWLGSGYRISKSSHPVRFCGQHTARGTYVMNAENIVGRDTAFADSLFIRAGITPSGDWTGRLYERLGTISVDTAALGKFTVNPDCSFTATLRVPEFFPDAIIIKGVFFNEGKEYYALALDDPALPPEQQGIKFSFVYGKRVGL